MSEDSVYDTFTFTGPCGCTIAVECGRELPHDCQQETP